MTSRNLFVWLLLFFVILSFSDLILTGYLLRQGRGTIYEGNPIANAWLYQFGWPGLVLFKALAMSVVASVAAFLSPRRPQVAIFVLLFSCLVVGSVLCYSYSLARSRLWKQPATTSQFDYPADNSNHKAL
jgi:Domain of unknown function (DUF5658)